MLHLGLDLRVSHKRIIVMNRIVIMYFFFSLTFLIVGLGLCLVTETIGGSGGISIPSPSFVIHPYSDLGLRLFGFGTFLAVASVYQSLVGERKISEKDARRQLWKTRFP